MEVGFWPPLRICDMAFSMKGQTKVAAASKGTFGSKELLIKCTLKCSLGLGYEAIEKKAQSAVLRE